MPVKKARLVYFSPTGTTREVVTSIGLGTSLHCQHIDMTLPDARQKLYYPETDELLIIGFPVYGGRLPAIHESIFALFPSGSYKVLPVIVYGNRAYDDALLELADVCCKKGFSLIGAGAFIGEHAYTELLGKGRPDATDKRLGAEFGRDILTAYRHGKRFDMSALPGNRPYKELLPNMPLAPTTPEDCVGCMICSKVCPVEAISSTDPHLIDLEKCILCAACIKRCPIQGKRILFQPLIEQINAMVPENISPKHPDLFLPNDPHSHP